MLRGHDDPIDFCAFAATTSGVLSPRAHALIARQRVAASSIPERDLHSLFVA